LRAGAGGGAVEAPEHRGAQRFVRGSQAVRGVCGPVRRGLPAVHRERRESVHGAGARGDGRDRGAGAAGAGGVLADRRALSAGREPEGGGDPGADRPGPPGDRGEVRRCGCEGGAGGAGLRRRAAASGGPPAGLPAEGGSGAGAAGGGTGLTGPPLLRHMRDSKDEPPGGGRPAEAAEAERIRVREDLAALARPRRTGSPGAAEAESVLRARLEALGYEITEHPFSFSAWPGRFGLPALGALHLAGAVSAAWFMARGSPGAAASVLFLVAAAAWVAGVNARRMIERLPWGRMTATNWLAVRPGAR